MTFHLSRFNPLVKSLFKGQEKGLDRRRIPIAARAKQSKKLGDIPLREARRLCDKPLFTLAGTNFELRGQFDERSRAIAAQVVSHFGTAFRGHHLKIETFGDDIYTVTASAHPQEEVLFTLDFDIDQANESIHMGNIESQRSGFGGRGVAALYNTAKSDGLGIINFVVTPDKIHAKQFYYHTDFGAPQEGNKRLWLVKVK